MNDIKVKWPKVIIPDGSPFLEWVDLGNYTMYRIAAFFANRPKRGLFVGIERVGAFFFRLPEKPFHWNYIEEKLNVAPSDAKALTDFINAQLFDEYPQAGEYSLNVLDAVRPFANIGEAVSMPVTPNIIHE